MIPTHAIRSAAIFAAAITMLITGQAAQAAPWKAVPTKAGVQYRIGNEIRNSFVINCPDRDTLSSGTWIAMTLFGQRLPRQQTIQIEIGGSIFRMEVGETGRIGTLSKDADRVFDLFWSALRTGSRMIVHYPDGLTGAFTLRGTTETMPPKACPTDFDRM